MTGVRNTDISISWERKLFLDVIKSIFHDYLMVIICWIKEKDWTQALSYLRILRNTIVSKRNS